MGAVVSTLAFPAPPAKYSKDLLLARRNELLFLKTRREMKIPAVHIRQAGAKFTIMYSHGNAEDVGLSLFYLDKMADVCHANLFAYEYPGYSISEGGEPSEQNCYDAIDAAYEYLTTAKGIDPSKIVLFGRSLGTGPTVYLSSIQSDVAGCILQSPLESAIRCVLGNVAAYSLYPFDIFRSYQKVHAIKCPVFIMHGEIDKVVPCSNGRALYATLVQRTCHVPYEPLWISWAGHNDMPEDECLKACGKFLTFLAQKPKIHEEESVGSKEDGILHRMADCMK
jgi:pimeloyl-ACP methyl ester carboxylesterase